MLRNRAPDHVVIGSDRTNPQIELEMTLLNWRNHFTCDLFAENGSAHIQSLCKWGPTSFTLRHRVLPSGRPPEDTVTLVQDDPTWALEYAHFKKLCADGHVTDLSSDVKLNRLLRELGEAAIDGRAAMSVPVIGFAGLTHLGLVSAIAVASKGFRVIGYDADAVRVGEMAVGRWRIIEPELDDLSRACAQRTSFTSRLDDLAACDLVYISTDVPTDDRGQSDLSGISSLDRGGDWNPVPPRAARRAVPGATGFHPRVWHCRKSVYFTKSRRWCSDARSSARRDRSALSSAVPSHRRRCRRSSRACSAPSAARSLPMRYESAELAKIAINCCLVASVTVANTLAELSECIGADWNEIVPALQARRRIGQCLSCAGPRHCRRQSRARSCDHRGPAEATGSETSVIRAFVANSLHRRDWAMRVLHSEVLAHKADAVIGILGLAYKENTHSTKNSPSLSLISTLAPWPLQGLRSGRSRLRRAAIHGQRARQARWRRPRGSMRLRS